MKINFLTVALRLPSTSFNNLPDCFDRNCVPYIYNFQQSSGLLKLGSEPVKLLRKSLRLQIKQTEFASKVLELHKRKALLFLSTTFDSLPDCRTKATLTTFEEIFAEYYLKEVKQNHV